jgi:hypothetical protein
VVAAGGFDPAFRRAEDVELAYRLASRGLRFVYNPDAVGFHFAERSFAAWLETPYQYGRNDVIFTRQKGQGWLLPTVLHEYRLRQKAIRALTVACLDRPGLSRLAIGGLKTAAAAGARLGQPALARLAYSGIFNLLHYQGIADEMGGRAAFFAGVAGATSRPIRPGSRRDLERRQSLEAS